MKKILIFIALTCVVFSIQAHPWKPGHFVIIDTDGGIDDFRTISMLLASPDIRVLGITITPGVLQGDEAYLKVKALLKRYYHEGIPVGINNSPEIKPRDFPVARSLHGENPLLLKEQKMML
ncbi:MAG: hypothetical protein HC830_03200 [Bacteroidetes bacterium]|nr:hypothetical protein [Bacteroidota bacterium]